MSEQASAAQASQQTPVSDEDAMGAALAEIQRSKAAGEPASVQGEPAQAAASTDAAAVAEPVKKPDEQTKTTEATAAAAPAAAAEKTPEQKLAETQAELHRAQSEIGRVSALNRANQEKAQRIADLERELQSARKPPETSEQALSELAALSEKVKDFPELASLVAVVGKALKEVETKAQASAKQAAQEVTASLEPLRQRDLERQAEQETAANAADLKTFSGTYPTAGEVVKSDDFKAWLPKQSKAVQWAFFKGQTPADAMPVMDAYDAHLRRSGKPSIAHTPQTTQQPAAAEPVKQASDRLSRATGIPSRATNGAKGALPPADDFEGSLEFFRQQRLDKEARAAAR